MALIKWREEFCTGIPGIDFEHRQLIEQIDSVYTLIDKNTDNGAVEREQVLDHLGDIYGSISAHFALEERMMETHGYDQYEELRTDHERLLDDIRDIADEFEMTTELNDEKLKQRLNEWFQLHFKTHDSRLHKLADLRSHDQIDERTMKTMILRAKNGLFRKTG